MANRFKKFDRLHDSVAMAFLQKYFFNDHNSPILQIESNATCKVIA